MDLTTWPHTARRALLPTLAAAITSLCFASSAAATTTQLLTNGGFEAGNLTGWTPSGPENSCPTWAVYRSGTQPCMYFEEEGGFQEVGPISAVEGSEYFANTSWDGEAGNNQSLTQFVAIPANTTDTLTWDDRIAWVLFEGAQNRVASVEVLGSGEQVLASEVTFTMVAGTEGMTPWTEHTLNLSAYAGQTVGIRFNLSVPETFTGPAEYSLDDVKLDSVVASPTALTGEASSITETSASLSASVNAGGSAVSSCEFEYGTSTAYGSTVACSQAPTSLESLEKVGAQLTGLAPNTEYHYRVSVTDANGSTSTGADGSFKTLAPPEQTASTPAPPAAPVAHCVVPFMRGLRKHAVEKALLAAHCRLGSLVEHYSAMPVGELVEQSLHQGTIEPAGTVVDVWFSKGADRHPHVSRRHDS